jgi:fructan beta-fructosidase
MVRRLKTLLCLLAPLGLIAQPAGIPTPQWRPVYHFTPEKNWTNDPNGLLLAGGVYHLYNQQNPFGNEWGHMSWGHATSTDLVHWDHLPLALPERVDRDTTWRFSGCAVFDAHNTSGFCKGGKGCMVAVYTADQPNRRLETQFVAYSNDGGLSLTDYAANPVIDLHRKDFRDPNVSWNENMHRWLMVVSMVDLRKVRFYSSPNLKEWTLLSEFGPYGYTGDVWECPFFVHLPVEGKPGLWKWLLAVSSGGPHGGPFIQYFVGDFNGKTFTCTQPRGDIRPVDYGNTFYAAIPWNGQPAGKRTYIGWIVPEPRATYPWRGAMSIPRDLGLRATSGGIVLTQQPAALIEGALPGLSRHRVDERSGVTLKGELGLGGPGIALWIKAQIKPGGASRVGFRIACDPATGEEVVVGYDKVTGSVYVDRSHSDTIGLTRGKFLQSMPVSPVNGVIDLEILMDKSILEVFTGHGERALTTLVFPSPHAGALSMFARGGTATLEHLRIWNLDNAPQTQPSPGTDTAHIPEFSIELSNGQHFTKAGLQPHKPVMIVYFSPNCEHCQHFGQDLAAHMDLFKGVQIVMVTFRPVSEVSDYVRVCHLEHAPVFIGSEGLTFVVQRHYSVQRFPFIAAYERNGRLGGIFRDPPDLALLHSSLFGHSAGVVK